MRRPARKGIIALGLVLALAVLLGLGVIIWGRQAAVANEQIAAEATSTASASDPARTPITTVDKVEVSWKTSCNLDRVHLDAEMQCQDCHQTYPPADRPGKETCLVCHGGTYAALADKTSYLHYNPHRGCLGRAAGQLPCTTCHGVHTGFDFYCIQCHRAGMDYTVVYPPPLGTCDYVLH